MMYAEYLSLKKGVNIEREINKNPNCTILKKELKQDKKYKKKFTLCVDLENVFLARIDLNDENDVKRFRRCKEMDKNFIILKKDKT